MNYQKGYEAGLNGWKYDLSLADNKEYNAGWLKGWIKRKSIA